MNVSLSGKSMLLMNPGQLCSSEIRQKLVSVHSYWGVRDMAIELLMIPLGSCLLEINKICE